MMIHVAYQILYSPVQSVLLGVYDTGSLSDTVQSSTVSSIGCVRLYVNKLEDR